VVRKRAPRVVMPKRMESRRAPHHLRHAGSNGPTSGPLAVLFLIFLFQCLWRPQRPCRCCKPRFSEAFAQYSPGLAGGLAYRLE
jgi:hypothetical protein